MRGISRSWWLAAAIVLAAALWMLSGSFGTSNAPDLSGTSQEEAPLPSVHTRLSLAEPMTSELVLTGRTAADRSVTIKAETAGVIAAVEVERGAAVHAGDTLLRFAVDEREARLLEARSQLAAAQTRYDASRSLKQQGYQAVIELGQAKAALNAAQAAVQMAELELQRVEVRAPFAGIVNERFAEIGDFVDRGQPLALLVDLDPIRVVGQASEGHLGRITAGVTARIRTLDGGEYAGQVSYVGRIADATTRTIPVEVRTANPDGRLIEGITAELVLPVAQAEAHRVPPSVLNLSDAGSLGVKSVDAAGVVHFHEVRILGGSGDALWLAGLPAELQLITVGQAFVEAGQTVTVVADGPATP